jgi:hypothetical protein
MAKKTACGKGKRADQHPKGLDTRFLPQGTDPLGVPLFVAVASSPPLDDSDDSQLLTSRGLAILAPTSRVDIDLAGSST